MKRIFKLSEIDCAVCAGKLEGNIAKLDGVNSASLNFMSLRLVVEVDDNKADDVVKSIYKTVKKFDRDIEVTEL